MRLHSFNIIGPKWSQRGSPPHGLHHGMSGTGHLPMRIRLIYIFVRAKHAGYTLRCCSSLVEFAVLVDRIKRSIHAELSFFIFRVLRRRAGLVDKKPQGLGDTKSGKDHRIGTSSQFSPINNTLSACCELNFRSKIRCLSC